MIEAPIYSGLCDYYVLVNTKQGVLGCAMMLESELCLSSMETAPNGAVTWTQRRVVVDLDKQLGPSHLLGFVDGPPGVFYLKIASCIFMVELKSVRVKKISISRFSVISNDTLIPYMSFYTLGAFHFQTLYSICFAAFYESFSSPAVSIIFSIFFCKNDFQNLEIVIPYILLPFFPDQAGLRTLPSMMASSSDGQVGDDQGKWGEEVDGRK
jgi:hypothetical protein